LPAGVARQTAAADLARRKAMRAAAPAALHHQLVAAGGLPEGGHLGRDLGQRLRDGAHAGNLERTSVECGESTPPFPETRSTSRSVMPAMRKAGSLARTAPEASVSEGSPPRCPCPIPQM